MKFTLDNSGLGNVDKKKILTHFVIYVLGYGLMAGVQYLLKLDFGQYTTVVNLLGGAVLDAIKKYLDGVKE